MPYIYGVDKSSSALKQAIGKTSGGCSDINAYGARRIDMKLIECRFELESPTTHILFLGGKGDVCIQRNGGASLGDQLAFYEYPPSHDGSSGEIHALEKASFNKNGIEPLFCHMHLTAHEGAFRVSGKTRRSK